MYPFHPSGHSIQRSKNLAISMLMILTQLAVSQELRQTDISINCRQNASIANERLLNAVTEEGFCPWSEECGSDSCTQECSRTLNSGKMRCDDDYTDESPCLSGPCIYSSPVPICYLVDVCQCTATSVRMDLVECCVQAIDSLIYKKKEMSRKMCFVPPDSPNQAIKCVSVPSLCETLKEYACEEVCRASTKAQPTTVPTTVSTSTIISTYNSGDEGSTVGMTWLRLVFYIGGPLLVILIVSVCVVIFNCVRKSMKSKQPEEEPDPADRYTTIDHPQRTECPPETRQPNIDNPMYDMQILGGSANDLSNSRPTSLTRSYENVSPSDTSLPSSPNSEHAMLLPGSKSSTSGNTSPNQLDVPVFNALHNRHRGTRSRVTFLDRTPSPQPDRKMFPGMSEEYEPISPCSEPNSPRDSTCDETIPMIQLSTKKDSGYENATLAPDGKLRTKKRDYGPGYENSSPDVTDGATNENIYDYADVRLDGPGTSISTSTAKQKSPTCSPNEVEYAIPGTHKFNFPKLRPVSRHDASPTSANQYNTLGTTTTNQVNATSKQGEDNGEYCKLRREGNEIMKAKEALKSLPDVIRVVPKPH